MSGAILFNDQLLTTKFFVPSAPHTLIARPHLTTLLDQGRRRKLTLISAPAGFGKTTLLTSWAQSLLQENPEAPHLAWVSLDEDDNEVVLFWTYLLTALDAQRQALCAPLLSYLRMQQVPKPPLRNILQALINILANSTEQVLLVLDDYHVITEPEDFTTPLRILWSIFLPNCVRPGRSCRSTLADLFTESTWGGVGSPDQPVALHA